MILAGQKDDKLVIIKRSGDPAVDTEIEIVSADEAERFAKAILQTVPRIRETEVKLGTSRKQKIQAELDAIEKRKAKLASDLKSA